MKIIVHKKVVLSFICAIVAFLIIFMISFKTKLVHKQIRLNSVNTVSASSSVVDRIHFIKSGGSDATLIESNGHYGLVDTSFSSDSSRPETEGGYSSIGNGKTVKNYLSKVMGNKKLDFVLMTHAHSDHIGGVPDIMGFVDSNTVIFYKEYKYIKIEEDRGWNNIYYYNLAISLFRKSDSILCETSGGNYTNIFNTINQKNSGVKNIHFTKGTYAKSETNVDDNINFNFGNYKIKLYSLYHLHDTSENTNTLMTYITKETQKILLAGDMNANKSSASGDTTLGVENQIADVIGDISLLKAGHHGGEGSNTIYELSKLKPEYTIIPTGWNGTVRDSFKFAAAYLKGKGKKVYVTGNSDGAIVADIYDNKIEINNYNSNYIKVGTAYNVENIITTGWWSSYNKFFESNDVVWGYVGSDSNLLKGWQKLEHKAENNTSKKWYYFNSDGIMQTGWVKINGYWYYLNQYDKDGITSGEMLTGWQAIGGAWYYFCKAKNEIEGYPEGAMVKGWQKLEYSGKRYWFYFVENADDYDGFKEGQMLTGRRLVKYNSKNNYYYFCEEKDKPVGYVKGAMISNMTYGGYTYDKSGACPDNVPPTLQLSYSPNTNTKTKGDVTVTITANEEIQGLSGWTLSSDKKKLTKKYIENKTEKVSVKDLVGNTRTIEVKVTNIDKTVPTIQLSYSPNTNTKTKGDVTVTITANEEIQGLSGWTLSSDKKKLTKKYIENKTEKVSVKDLVGNTKSIDVKVTNIDKTAPTIQVNYSPNTNTKGKVTVTITANEEIQKLDGWTLSENKKSISKIYSNNITETIIVKDIVGNTSNVTVKVENINIYSPKIESTKYIIEDNKISKISPNTTKEELLKNMIITYEDIKIYDKNRNEINTTDKIGTGMKIVLDNNIEYTIIVTGDTNGDGQTNIVDLLQLNRHRLNKTLLEGIYFEAGDVNVDKTVNILDLLIVNKYRLGKISL